MQNRRTWLLAFSTVALLVGVSQVSWWFYARRGITGSSSVVDKTPAPLIGIKADISHLPVVYTSDFTKPPGNEWIGNEVSTTPKDHLPFLGQFGNETVSLNVHSLPPHSFVHLTFKLYIINTWDGIAHHNGGARIGPDYWSLGVGDGRNLIRSTFSNTNDDPGFTPYGKFQNYPAPIPSDPVLWGTGGDSKNALGYIFRFKGYDVEFPMDTVYTVDVTIPHTADAVEFKFGGAELTPVSDEGWGLADVKLEALAAADVPKIDEAQFDKLLADTAGMDAVAANKAFWKLVTGGDQTVGYLAANVHSLEINSKDIAQLIDRLLTPGDKEFPRAVSILTAYGPAVEPSLEAARASVGSAIIDAIEHEIILRPIVGPERRRAAVAARLLQIINTDNGKKALDALLAAPTAPPAPDDWAVAMAGTYSLDQDDVLKYIPPPWMDTRVKFWKQQQSFFSIVHGQGPDQLRPMPSQLVFRMYDREIDPTTDVIPIYWQQIKPGVYGPPPGLNGILSTLGISTDGQGKNTLKVVIPAGFEDIDLRGDWMVRGRTPQAALLKALEMVLQEQTGRVIGFEAQQTEQDVIKVSGTFAFKALDNVQPNDQLLVFAGDTPAPGDSAMTEGTSDMRDFVRILTSYYRRPFVSTASGVKKVFKWRFLQSSRIGQELKPEEIDAVLKNIAKQTGLELKRDKQQVDVLVATDKGKPKVER